MQSAAENDLSMAMTAWGIHPPQHFVWNSGKITRFDTKTGKVGNSGSGFYRLWIENDFASGFFGDWKLSEKYENWWYSEKKDADYTESVTIRNISAYKEIDQEPKEAVDFNGIWSKLNPITSHEYIKRKGIKPYAARESNGRVAVPMYLNGVLSGIQFIFANGDKRYLTGSQKTGSLLVLPAADNQCGDVYVCEGYATGCTIREATNAWVVIAFDCHNLLSIVDSVFVQFNWADRIVFAADDDYRVSKNPGITTAEKAAKNLLEVFNDSPSLKQVSIEVIAPEFGNFRGEKSTDFNDMADSFGLLRVKQLLEGKPRNMRAATLKECNPVNDWCYVTECYKTAVLVNHVTGCQVVYGDIKSVKSQLPSNKQIVFIANQANRDDFVALCQTTSNGIVTIPYEGYESLFAMILDWSTEDKLSALTDSMLIYYSVM